MNLPLLIIILKSCIVLITLRIRLSRFTNYFLFNVHSLSLNLLIKVSILIKVDFLLHLFRNLFNWCILNYKSSFNFRYYSKITFCFNLKRHEIFIRDFILELTDLVTLICYTILVVNKTCLFTNFVLRCYRITIILLNNFLSL